MDENGRKRKLKAEATRWLIFFGVAIVLSVLLWLGLSLTGRKNPITSFGTLVSDSSVTVGIEGNAPKSLDIRTEQGTAVEQALLDQLRQAEQAVENADFAAFDGMIAELQRMEDELKQPDPQI